MRKIIIFHVFLFIALSLFTQNADLNKMSNTYLKAKSYKMNIEMVMVKNYNKVPTTETYKGYVVRSGNNFYSELMGVINLYNSSLHIIVDQTSKTVKCLPPLTQMSMASINEFFSAGDSLYYKNYTIKQVQSVAGFKTVELVPKAKSTFKNMRIKMAIPSNTLTSVEYSYEDNAPWCKILINYTYVRLNIQVKNDVFSENKFIKRVRNKMVLTDKYKKYQMINYLKNN